MEHSEDSDVTRRYDIDTTHLARTMVEISSKKSQILEYLNEHKVDASKLSKTLQGQWKLKRIVNTSDSDD